jgi:superoxide reductase
MTEQKQIWKCEVCGNIIEILHKGADSLVCCNQSMILQKENTIEQEGKEKHIPIIKKDAKGVVIKVGSVPHPMEEKHYIEWIEISTEKGESKKFLKPGEKPEAKFPVKADISEIHSRAYCNIHGLWTSN